MKIKTKKLSARVARQITASLIAGGFVLCKGSFAFAADDNGNNKTVTSETASANITGGNTNSGDANDNKLTVSDTDANNKEILGGATGNSTGNASNNTVTLRNVKNISFVDGGIASQSSGVSNHNTVYIWDSELINVHGGHTGYGSANHNKVYFYSGTVSEVTGAGIITHDGEASFNELYVYGGTLNGLVQGGYTYPSASGKTNYNLVEVHGGTINGQIMGGYVSVDGQANNNTVNIYGGTINGEILGGHVGSGEVSGNTINIYGGDISNAVLRAGDIGGSDAPFGSGNALNFYTKDIIAKNASGFDKIGFYLPSSVKNGDTILTLTDNAGTRLNQTKISMSTQGGTNLNEGDSITLFQNTSGGMSFDINAINQANPNAVISHGIAWDNYASFEPITNASTQTGLKVNVGSRTTDGLKRQTQLLGEGAATAISMIDSGTDRLLNWLPPEELEIRGLNETTQFEFFMGAGVEFLNIDTGANSKLKNKNGGTNIGAARALKNRHGMFIFAPITDYGASTYTSSLDDGTRGAGNSQYFTAGLIARQWNNNGMYYEGSFRAGRLKTGFVSDNFYVGNEPTHVSYTDHTPCYTGHVRIGWRGNVSPQNIMDIYGIYSHNHVSGIDAEISKVNQTYHLDSSDSKRFRIGARLTREINEHNRFYSELAYQYEFGGEVIGNYMGYETRKVGLKGSSGMIEFGWQLKPTPNSAVMLDSALVGWVGKQKGFAFQCKLKKSSKQICLSNVKKSVSLRRTFFLFKSHNELVRRAE